MIHLITVAGQSARKFHLVEACISDFKALMRTITSGRVMIVSTKFRSDLFYSAEKPEHDSILKLWAFYAKAELSDLNKKDIQTYVGRKVSFTEYFQSVNKLSFSWHYYRLYQKAFYETYSNDQQNPVTMIVVGCDQHLVAHPSITREPLLGMNQSIKFDLAGDTFMLAMHILKNETHAN